MGLGPLDTTVPPALLAALTALSVVAAVVRVWLRHRTAVLLEREHTQRVRLAVVGSEADQRAAVVRACAELESASRAGTAGHTGTGGKKRAARAVRTGLR